MSIAETVDSVPMFKKALQSLTEEYADKSNLSSIIDVVERFSANLSRRSDIEQLRKSITGLELLLSSLDQLVAASPTSETGVFGSDHFDSQAISGHFDTIFTELSASLPNVFASDEGERTNAINSTISHLKEIAKYAELNGNSHVVSLSDAMISVVEFHRDSLGKSEPPRDNSFLVKPLLRGFALLRTAFDSPDEPNLSPALIDSTANLRDLIGIPAAEAAPFDFEPSEADFDFEDLADETVVQSDLSSLPKRGATQPSDPTLNPASLARTSDSKKTIAFSSISALVPPSSPPEKTTDVSLDTSDSADLHKRKTNPNPSASLPKKIDTLFCGFEEKSTNLTRFTSIVPMSVHTTQDIESTLEILAKKSFDLIVCNESLQQSERDQLVEHINALEPSLRIPLIHAKKEGEDAIHLSLPNDVNPYQFLLTYLKPEKDANDLLSDITV